MEKGKTLPTKADEKMKELMLCQAAGAGMTFYNTSRFVFQPTEAAKGKKYVSLLVRPGADRRQPDQLHRRVLRQCPRDLPRQVQVRRPDQPPR